MKIESFICGTVVLVVTATAQNPSKISVHGYVYVDKNNNGIRDKNEEGVKDVGISDQREIVVTNAEGHYRLESDGTRRLCFREYSRIIT